MTSQTWYVFRVLSIFIVNLKYTWASLLEIIEKNIHRRIIEIFNIVKITTDEFYKKIRVHQLFLFK